MLRVVPIQSFRIAENGGGLFKGHAVLLQVAQGFSGIPRKHIYVYTLIWGIWEGLRENVKGSPHRYGVHREEPG